jgi:hypothetical protein
LVRPRLRSVDFDVAQKIATLTFASSVDLATNKVVVTFLQANFPNVTSAEPAKVGVSKKFAPAKGSADADIYLSGSVTAAEGAKPAYAVVAKLGYLFGLGTDGRLGSLGPSSDFALNQNASANSNHIKAAAAYEKFFPMASSAGWMFHSNFIGGEFDQKGTTKNLVSDLSMRLVLPSVHLDTHTFVTMDFLFGYEGGKNYQAPQGVVLGSFDRKLLGATGYYLLLHPGPFDRITLTGEYRVRLPSIAEPFVPSSNATTIFTLKPRHHAAVDLNVMLSKAIGITAQYRWGSLPPLFQFVNHSVVVGLVLQLKQAN